MKNITRNTAAVLVLTLFTGLAVFTAIQLGDRLFGTPEASAQAATTPAAGQSSSDDQGTDEYDYDDGTSGYGNGNGQGSGGSSQGYSDPYGYGDSGSSSSGSGTTQTCPATGCSASSCHATQ
jgi:hypothetical protein